MARIVSAVPPTMPEVLPQGTIVDRHVLDDVLRKGGMATVYLGHHRSTGARVAIKVLHTQFIHQPDFVARFEREAHVMGRLSGCPQIVSVHDVGRLPDGRHYLVMDFVRGHDLRDELEHLTAKDERMHVPRAVSLMRDVASALASAHAADVIHRDVKPSNIMLESSAGREVAKLLDFGVSADLGEVGRKQELTTGDTLIGTTRYMAPEQAAGISNVVTVDVWGMGVVLLEMLTGRPPPARGWGLKGASLEHLPPIPDDLRRLLEAMLQPDATRRIQSARDVEARLLELLPSLGVETSTVVSTRPQHVRSPPPATVVAPRPRSSRRPVLWGAGLGVLIIAGATAGWLGVRALSTTPNAPDTVLSTAAAQTSTAAAPSPSAPEPLDVPVRHEAEPPPPVVPSPNVVEPNVDLPPPEPPQRPATPTRKPRPRGPTTPCAAVAQEARDAAILGEWKTVLGHTSRKRCWDGAATDRERLRVRALHKLGRHRQCEREGQESGDPSVWSTVELCRQALSKNVGGALE